MDCLPFDIAHVGVLPIKCQGIKTKLVPFIFSSIRWNAENARWIEPFLGSGVVALNLMPERALLADTNRMAWQNSASTMIRKHQVFSFWM